MRSLGETCFQEANQGCLGLRAASLTAEIRVFISSHFFFGGGDDASRFILHHFCHDSHPLCHSTTGCSPLRSAHFPLKVRLGPSTSGIGGGANSASAGRPKVEPLPISRKPQLVVEKIGTGACAKITKDVQLCTNSFGTKHCNLSFFLSFFSFFLSFSLSLSLARSI